MKPTDRIYEIEQRLQAATPGEWSVRIGFSGSAVDTNAFGLSHPGVVPIIRDRDAEFIAHAPTDISWLLARVRELEAEKVLAWSDGWNKGYENWITEKALEDCPYLTDATTSLIKRCRELAWDEGFAVGEDYGFYCADDQLPTPTVAPTNPYREVSDGSE